MDNLTHSLAGALLGQMGLKRLTGRAMATLVIAANVPDVDAVATVLGTESLAIRRGITHGPLALLLLPPLLTALMLLWNRYRPAAEPVRAAPLLLLAYIGTLSHPALDWLNSYGIRLLEPFSSRWFYGDTLFIIDIWIWATLVLGLLISSRREKRGADGRPAAAISCAAIVGYIMTNGLITHRAEALAQSRLEALRLAPTMVVANPQPLTFWTRRILWRNAASYGAGDFTLGQPLRLERKVTPTHLDHSGLTAARARADVQAYLLWSRMPVVVEREGSPFLGDQRFDSRLTQAQFLLPLPPAGAAE